MSVKICKDNLFHSMSGAKIYINGAWHTVKDLDKIYFGGRWRRINHDTHTWGDGNQCTVCGEGGAFLSASIDADTTYRFVADGVSIDSQYGAVFPSLLDLRSGNQQIEFYFTSTNDKTPRLQLIGPGGEFLYDGNDTYFQLNCNVIEGYIYTLVLFYLAPTGGTPIAKTAFFDDTNANNYLDVNGTVLATTSQNSVTLPVGTFPVKFYSMGVHPRYQDLYVYRTRNGNKRELYHHLSPTAGLIQGNSVSYNAELEICRGDVFEFKACNYP